MVVTPGAIELLELFSAELVIADELASLVDDGLELGVADDTGAELTSNDELVPVRLDEEAVTELGAALLGDVGDLLPLLPPPQATRLMIRVDNSPCCKHLFIDTPYLGLKSGLIGLFMRYELLD